MAKIFWAILIAIAFAACSSDDPVIDCENSGPVIAVDEIVDATGCSTNDGSIRISVSGGATPYKFSLNNQLIETTGTLENLTAGVYSVLVTDANNCISSIDNLSVMAEGFAFTSTVEPSTGCSTGNGAVTIDVTGDNPPYSFKLGNIGFTPENSFSNLRSGNHVIAIRDNSNCIVNVSIAIPQGITGVSWINDIKPIMDKDCAISGCHNGTSRSNDFRNYNSAKSFAATIKSKTQDRSMPFDGALTQNEINLIACWVNDGALQN
jgi:hypothetical protein